MMPENQEREVFPHLHSQARVLSVEWVELEVSHYYESSQLV